MLTLFAYIKKKVFEMKNISGKKVKIFWLAPIILLVIAIIGDPVIALHVTSFSCLYVSTIFCLQLL